MSINAEMFLRLEVKMEPLVCGWYAWTHLVSPAQHALNVVHRHLPLLQSFVKNPAVHLAATADRSLFGGPFVQLAQDCVKDVERLLQDTEKRCAKLIAFGRDLKQLDRELQEAASGYSLGDFYSRLPESLSGLVEFIYDLNCHPRIRIQEELLYDENPGAGTQEIMLADVGDRDRAFFMSTPRLESSSAMLFQMPFSDERVDLLAAMRTQPEALDTVAAALGVNSSRRETFRQFFTEEPPTRNSTSYQGDGVRLRYFGHACVLIQTREVSVLIDPMLAWGREEADGRYSFSDLPDHIDYVVLSHNHQDHCAPEMLLQLRHRVGRVVVPANNSGCVADPSMRLALNHLGFRCIDVLGAFDTLPLPGGRITSLPFPGEHVDLDIHSRHGIHLDINGRKLAFLVDSDGRDPMLFRRIVKRIGRHVNALFIGMECHGAPLTWLYGPLLTKPINRRNDESRRLSGLDSERAWSVVREFDADNIYVYAMGQEPWLRYIMGLEYSPDSIQLREVAAFLQRCREADISAENLYISKEVEI